MVNKILVTYLIFDLLLAICGAGLLAVSLVSRSNLLQHVANGTIAIENVAELLLVSHYPLNLAIACSVLSIIAFALSIPAILSREKRIWFKAHGWIVALSALFMLCLGLYMWFGTLTTRSTAEQMWEEEGGKVRSLLQEKWNCCGYSDSMSPPFEIGSTCPTSLVAAQKQGCVGPFSKFVKKYLDIIVGSLFGVVGLHALIILSIAMVLKDRKERARYKLIDAKAGFGSI